MSRHTNKGLTAKKIETLKDMGYSDVLSRAIVKHEGAAKVVITCLTRGYTASLRGNEPEQIANMIELYLIVVIQAVEEALLPDDNVYRICPITGQVKVSQDNTSTSRLKLRREARNWIFNKSDEDDFIEICTNAGLNFDCVREKVRRALDGTL